MFATLSARKRPMALLVAFALAGVATAALASYVHGLETRATFANETVGILVAKETIPARMSVSAALSRGLIEEVQVPQRLVAAGAVSSLEAVRDRVAAVEIARGEQLLATRLISSTAAAGLLPIPAGKQAISVALDASPGVGGFVRPNDHVSVLAKIEVGSGNATVTKVGFLLQNVTVLAVGSKIATADGATRSSSASTPNVAPREQTMLTLAVSPADAERLAFAVLEGELYFTLLSRTDPATGRTRGRTAATVFTTR